MTSSSSPRLADCAMHYYMGGVDTRGYTANNDAPNNTFNRLKNTLLANCEHNTAVPGTGCDPTTSVSITIAPPQLPLYIRLSLELPYRRELTLDSAEYGSSPYRPSYLRPTPSCDCRCATQRPSRTEPSAEARAKAILEEADRNWNWNSGEYDEDEAHRAEFMAHNNYFNDDIDAFIYLDAFEDTLNTTLNEPSEAPKNEDTLVNIDIDSSGGLSQNTGDTGASLPKVPLTCSWPPSDLGSNIALIDRYKTWQKHVVNNAPPLPVAKGSPRTREPAMIEHPLYGIIHTSTHTLMLNPTIPCRLVRGSGGTAKQVDPAELVGSVPTRDSSMELNLQHRIGPLPNPTSTSSNEQATKPATGNIDYSIYGSIHACKPNPNPIQYMSRAERLGIDDIESYLYKTNECSLSLHGITPLSTVVLNWRRSSKLASDPSTGIQSIAQGDDGNSKEGSVLPREGTRLVSAPAPTATVIAQGTSTARSHDGSSVALPKNSTEPPSWLLPTLDSQQFHEYCGPNPHGRKPATSGKGCSLHLETASESPTRTRETNNRYSSVLGGIYSSIWASGSKPSRLDLNLNPTASCGTLEAVGGVKGPWDTRIRSIWGTDERCSRHPEKQKSALVPEVEVTNPLSSVQCTPNPNPIPNIGAERGGCREGREAREATEASDIQIRIHDPPPRSSPLPGTHRLAPFPSPISEDAEADVEGVWASRWAPKPAAVMIVPAPLPPWSPVPYPIPAHVHVHREISAAAEASPSTHKPRRRGCRGGRRGKNRRNRAQEAGGLEEEEGEEGE